MDGKRLIIGTVYTGLFALDKERDIGQDLDQSKRKDERNRIFSDGYADDPRRLATNQDRLLFWGRGKFSDLLV